ncbi:conserved hypothetical protein [Magnetococcus marinus MC-1]|uniref:Transposase n=1 Tax=Magnetococcus marinus (strain ATCC BAA-1437 / JCM 17883 / MC-1) TaxID=156889 RepID=A0LBE3_MAGMM|nr:conserved hypothetical protein [Magnetococcus marinus MC-1]
MIVFGTLAVLINLLNRSTVSETIKTAFVERNNATDRHQNAHKGRKTLCFSKGWDVHNAVMVFVAYIYNFCWPICTLRMRVDEGKYEEKTPTMSAGLADHVWTVVEWVSRLVMPIRS